MSDAPFPKPDLTKFADADLLGDNLIVQRWNPKQMSEGGIVLPDSAQEMQAVGWVVHIGQNVDPAAFTTGDTVIFPAHALQELPEVGGEYQPRKYCEFNYLRAADVVLRYPVQTEIVSSRGEPAQMIPTENPK